MRQVTVVASHCTVKCEMHSSGGRKRVENEWRVMGTIDVSGALREKRETLASDTRVMIASARKLVSRIKASVRNRIYTFRRCHT